MIDEAAAVPDEEWEKIRDVVMLALKTMNRDLVFQKFSLENFTKRFRCLVLKNGCLDVAKVEKVVFKDAFDMLDEDATPIFIELLFALGDASDMKSFQPEGLSFTAAARSLKEHFTVLAAHTMLEWSESPSFAWYTFKVLEKGEQIDEEDEEEEEESWKLDPHGSYMKVLKKDDDRGVCTLDVELLARAMRGELDQHELLEVDVAMGELMDHIGTYEKYEDARSTLGSLFEVVKCRKM